MLLHVVGFKISGIPEDHRAFIFRVINSHRRNTSDGLTLKRKGTMILQYVRNSDPNETA
jgi:hypothetical protein